MISNRKFEDNISDEDIYRLDNWLSNFRFSKQISNIRRDFSDGVLFAEIIKQCDYKLVQIINYVPTLNYNQKKINWETLNKKVLYKLNCILSKDEIEGLCNCKENYAEICLLRLMSCLQAYLNELQDNKKMKDDDDTFYNNKIQFNKKNFYLNEIYIRKQKIAELQSQISVS